MRGHEWLLGLALLGARWSGIGAEPDPEEVRRRMELYEREAGAEAAKSAPKPAPKPTVDHGPDRLAIGGEMWDGGVFRGVSNGLSEGPIRADGASAVEISSNLSCHLD